MIPFLRKRFSLLMASEGGSALLLVSLGMVMLITAVGAAVDMSRLQTLQSRVASALDAAALAAGANASNIDPNSPCASQTGSAATTCWVQQEAQRYFNANIPSGYLSSNNPIIVNAALNNDGTITLTATGTQNTTFMQVVGVNTMNVGATTIVTLAQNSGVELALVLDNSGSMGAAVSPSDSSTSKMTALIQNLTGAGGLLDILSGGQPTLPSGVFVGLAPFSGSVNIAPADLPNILGANYTSQSPLINRTMGSCHSIYTSPSTDCDCVDARSTNLPSTLESGLSSTLGIPLLLDETDDLPTNSASSSDFNLMTAYAGGWGGWVIGCPKATVMSLTNNKATLTTAINNMAPTGGTMLQLGMAWGWRVLSPNWRGLWNTPNFNGTQLPLNYHTVNMQKVLVLMTDGMNLYDWNSAYNAPSVTYPTPLFATLFSQLQACQAANANEGCYPIPDQQQYFDYNYYGPTPISPTLSGLSGNDNAYQFYQGSNQLVPSLSGNDHADLETLAICSALKQQGVIIYTIGYGMDTPSNYTPVLSPYSAANFSYPATTPAQDAPGNTSSSCDLSPIYPLTICQYNYGSLSNTCNVNPGTMDPSKQVQYCAYYQTDPYTYCIIDTTKPLPVSNQLTGNCYVDRLNSGSYVATNLLQQCATDSAHYFNAPTNAKLAAAFQTIGAQVSALRISK